MLGLGERPALGDFHRVAFLRLVFFVVRVQRAAALEVLAVLRVPHLVVHDYLDRLVALVRSDHTRDGAEQRTLSGLVCLVF